MKDEIYQKTFLKLSILKLPYCVVCERLKKIDFQRFTIFYFNTFPLEQYVRKGMKLTRKQFFSAMVTCFIHLTKKKLSIVSL